jgi:hypothetical protein
VQSSGGCAGSAAAVITEDLVKRGGGACASNFPGQGVPFRPIATAVGLGSGLSKITASDEVYNVASIEDFTGQYTQNTGKVLALRCGEIFIRMTGQ